MATTGHLSSATTMVTAASHRLQANPAISLKGGLHVEHSEKVRLDNINSLPREVLNMIFETFNTHQGKRRGKLSLLVQQYIRDPCSVSFEKGFESDRTAMFRCLGVCKLWRDVVVDVLFVKSSRFWSYPERTRKYVGLMKFVKDAECFRPPELGIVLVEGDLHRKCRWQDICACELVVDIVQCPYRDID